MMKTKANSFFDFFKSFIMISFLFISMVSCSQNKVMEDVKFNTLTDAEANVIINKGTERPFSGKYLNHQEEGTYTCKRCDAPLYRSDDKFEADCGWPAFDDEIEGAVKHVPDADGRRTEIVCANCGAHLGHVFEGERYTDKNVRHCVNSISMNFIGKDEEVKQDTAIFAAGCFWGVEFYFQKAKGVLSTQVGYLGGKTQNPSYQEVSYENTGHAEALQVVFDANKVSYEDLCKLFFEIHDFSQVNRQGPDVGEQYRSEIFYLNEEQKSTALKIMEILKQKNYKIATKLTPASTFWKAEEYHQDYYAKKGGIPYCHTRKKIF